MQQLSTENHIIIFKDRSTKWITQAQRDSLLPKYTDPSVDKILISGNAYDKQIIGKILTAQEYYAEYPEHKPDPTKPKPVDFSNSFERKIGNRKRAVESMVRGFVASQTELYGSQWQKYARPDTLKLYSRMQEKLNSIV